MITNCESLCLTLSFHLYSFHIKHHLLRNFICWNLINKSFSMKKPQSFGWQFLFQHHWFRSRMDPIIPRIFVHGFTLQILRCLPVQVFRTENSLRYSHGQVLPQKIGTKVKCTAISKTFSPKKKYYTAYWNFSKSLCQQVCF